jgi:hypothetical protein
MQQAAYNVWSTVADRTRLGRFSYIHGLRLAHLRPAAVLPQSVEALDRLVRSTWNTLTTAHTIGDQPLVDHPGLGLAIFERSFRSGVLDGLLDRVEAAGTDAPALCLRDGNAWLTIRRLDEPPVGTCYYAEVTPKGGCRCGPHVTPDVALRTVLDCLHGPQEGPSPDDPLDVPPEIVEIVRQLTAARARHEDLLGE